MSIHLKALSPDSYHGLSRVSEERGWAEIQPWMEPGAIAWLIVRLEFVTDEEDFFPRGKWATIQRLQDMVREFARLEKRDEQPRG